ncbi:MAG TPA: flippase activity-associated protein Agl23 [Methanoregulaceae archaeon]|nr:flippase activity-associated protein Agl23 [Methanoregulaceae archaeon]
MSAATFFSGISKKLTFERLFIIIILIAIVIRFLFLDLKLLHHDESIHAWFSYELLTKGTYTYDPMYHGPLLYYLTAGMFWLFGQSDLVARLLPALFGTLLVPLVYFIYRLGYLDKRQALVAALFIAVSPDMVYFSRFLRHDIFQLFFTLLILVALLWYLNSGKFRYVLLTAIGVAGGMSLKEDMPIFLLIFLLFGLYLLISRKIVLPKTWKRDALIGIIIAIGIIALLYSSFGTQPNVLETGWIAAYQHWTAMSNECRICGPWFFYIILLILYEVPILILAIVGVIQFAGKDNRLRKLLIDTWARIRGFGNTIGKGHLPQGEIKDRPALSTHELVTTSIRQFGVKTGHEVKKDRRDDFFVFCLFWLVVSMAAYAVIGEKVPWLIIHQLLPLIFISVYMMTRRKMVIALIFAVLLVLITWHVAFVPADINEPIVQVQNSEDMKTVMGIIDASNIVVIASKDYWPLPWYDRGHGWDKMRFYGEIIDKSAIYQQNPDMVITHDLESYPSLDGYDKRTYKLSYWFSYIDNQDRLPEYYFLRDGPMGSINIDVFTKVGTKADEVMMSSPESGQRPWEYPLVSGYGQEKGAHVPYYIPNPFSGNVSGNFTA